MTVERVLPHSFIKELDNIVCKCLKNKVFTACSIGVHYEDQRVESADEYFYGTAGEVDKEIYVDSKVVFDLASLTKPLVTVLSLLTLIEEGKCHPYDSLDNYFGSSVPADKKGITLHHLLTHSSGLPAHRPYYEKLHGVKEEKRLHEVVDWILAEELQFEPVTDTLYSDLGFILLGRIIEIVSGYSLDAYWQRKIIRPLKLEKDLFFASRRDTDNNVYVPTGVCPWSNMSLYGHVHDDNCRALGGVAGHAGLFGTLGGVITLCKELLGLYQGKSDTLPVRVATLRKMLEIREGEWYCGFDSPTKPLSSSGKYFSTKTIGHLGFTGTSFWIDLQEQIIIVLLTNRVFCGESLTAIQRVRPKLHDCIMKNVIKNTRAG